DLADPGSAHGCAPLARAAPGDEARPADPRRVPRARPPLRHLSRPAAPHPSPPPHCDHPLMPWTRTRALMDLLPWELFVGEGLLLNADGALTATVRLRGPDPASSTRDELLGVSRTLVQ